MVTHCAVFNFHLKIKCFYNFLLQNWSHAVGGDMCPHSDDVRVVTWGYLSVSMVLSVMLYNFSQ